MEKPTIPELDQCLRDVVKNWKRFALHLPGMNSTNISVIELNKRDDVVEQKIAVYDKWLQVYPNASWDNVINALETAEENTIAKQLREKYPAITPSIVVQPGAEPHPHEKHIVSSPHSLSATNGCSTPRDDSQEISVPEEVVTELDSLEQSFCCLTHDVKSEVQSTEEKNGNIEDIVFHVQEARAFRIDSLQSVRSTNELFAAIHPHYHFLNCHLIVRIALFLAGIIADKATKYKENVVKFMKATKIRFLRNVLKQYHQISHRSIQGASNAMVEIRVENGWGDQNLWLVEMLVKTLFPVKHPDELPWYDIVPGSVVMTFIALEHMTPSLIESSRKQTEFMRLIGVISLKIGNELVWKNSEVNKKSIFSFEDSLIQATLADNIEAVQFLLQYTQVNVNTKNINSLFISRTSTVNWLRKHKLQEILKSFYASYRILLKNIEHELPNLKKPWPPGYENFLNSKLLLHLSNYDKLSKPLLRRIQHYRQSLKNMVKKQVKVATFAVFLEQYFSAPFPDSIEVVVTLHSVWSTCSVWYFEQLGKLIFTPTLFHKLQWFRVDASEELLRVVLLADKEVMDSLVKRCLGYNESSLLGVIYVRVDDKVVISNDYNCGYTFNKAIELAKAVGNDEMSEFFLKIDCKPMQWKGVSVDINNNICFLPESDSTPLMIACHNDNSQLVQLLLDHNADPNIQNGRGITALMYSTGNIKIFQMLLDRGADILKITLFNESLLHFACIAGNVKVVKSLIMPHFVKSIDANSSNGSTPLMLASAKGHTTVVEVLLEAGADPDLQDFEGYTALMRGTYHGFPAVVEVLLQAKANPDIRNNDEYTAFYLAIDKIDSGAAIDDNTQQILNQFVQAEASLNILPQLLHNVLVQNEDSQDPEDKMIVEASEFDGFDITLSVFCQEGLVQIVKALLEKKKANPNNTLINGRTPLMHAMFGGHTALVKILLEAPADPNIQDVETGETALMMACRRHRNVKLIDLLLQAGANPTLMDNDGETALDVLFVGGNDIDEVTYMLCENVNNTTNVYILVFTVAVCFSYLKWF